LACGLLGHGKSEANMSIVQSDVRSQDGAVALASEKEKRVIKHTAKGLEMFIENCQKTRNLKCKQAMKLMTQMKELMKSKENASEVQSNLNELINICDEAKRNHESLVKLPLPENELEKQNHWFQQKMDMFDGFSQDVNVWFSEVGWHKKHSIVESVNTDDIGPDDSVSNVSKPKSSHKSSSSSRASSTSSARIKAQAEKAALMERVSALQKKHDLEAQEEQLKRKKEQLELETELAATNAKINVLESRNSSRVSDGMNSYLRKGTAQQKTSVKLNPHAKTYLPDQVQQRHNVWMGTASSSQQVVRPKERADGPSVRAQDMNHLIQQPVFNDGNQDNIYHIIERQNDITALLAQQNLSSTLPPRDIPVYDGDPLQYEVFIRAFERGVERKTDEPSDCLHFLEQYTRGHPKDLVHSCQHMSSI